MDKEREYILKKIYEELDEIPTIYLLYKIRHLIQCVKKSVAKKEEVSS